MKNVAVFFGGKTVEHDVSIITGLQLIENAPKSINIIPVYISRDGNWYSGNVLEAKAFENFDKNKRGVVPVFMDALASNKTLFEAGRKPKPYAEIDAVIIAMHGMNGEDGTLQGLFELKDMAYSSPGVVGSAVGMDKIVMKCAFAGLGLPVLPMVFFERCEWEKKSEEIVKRIEDELGYPVVVKPANLGSSIGISKAKDKEGLINAINVAVNFDKRILVEKAVTAIKEINCSVLGDGASASVGITESPVSGEDILSFADKYLNNAKTSGMKSLERIVPSDAPEAVLKQVEEISLKAFAGLDLKGVCRIDYIYDKAEEKLYINEVNTIPGSFAFYLWEPKGMPYSKLIEELVKIAENNLKEKHKSSYAYASNILDKASGSKVIKK